MEQQRQPQANTRRNCDYCVEKKVRCSGRIEGAACAYCARKKHVCVFSVKQKPGPKCLNHQCEEGSSAEESPAVFPAVAAISSAAAALTLEPSGASSSSAAAAAAATRPPVLKSGGGWSGGGDGGDEGRASSSSSPKRKALGTAAAAAARGRLEEAGAGGGKPATFLNFGPDGGASLPGLPRTASGGAPSMMSGRSPAAGAGPNGGLMDRIGGDKPLSVGTLGAGNGGSFVSGLSEFANGGAAGEMEGEEEDHRAVFAKIFEELGPDASVDEHHDQDQQNQPPVNKKAKTNPLSGLEDSLHQQLQGLQQQRKPRGSRPSGCIGGGGGGGGPPTRPPRHDALKTSTITAQRIATHAAAAAAAVEEIAKAGETAPPQHQHHQHHQQQQHHRLLSRMDSADSWRRLLSNRNSFLVDGDGTSSGGAGNSNISNNNNNNNNYYNHSSSSSSIGGGLTSKSSWAAGRAAAADIAAAGANPADSTANLFLGGFRGRVGPVAEPLDPLLHARSHSYGLGDWLPPADMTRDRDLDAFAGALPGVAAAVDDGAGAATPLTGGIVAGRDHQF